MMGVDARRDVRHTAARAHVSAHASEKAAKRPAYAVDEGVANGSAREAASRLLRRCGLEPMLLRCRKVELLQARGEVLGPAAEAISREALSAALRAFYSALFQDPAPDLDAIAPDAQTSSRAV